MRILALILAGLAASTLNWSSPSMAAATTATKPTRFSVDVRGQGPDVILIPGLSSTRDVFAASAGQLERSHRVHLVQLKGFGEAAGPNADGPVLQPFVDDLVAYIRANEIHSPAIVGHSMGGLAALMLASQAPELPGRLMIVDAFPFIGTVFGADSVDAIGPRAEQMRSMLLGNAAKVTPDFTRRPDCPTGQPAPAQVAGNMTNSALGQCLMRHGALASDLRVVAQAMYDDMVTDMRPKLAGIRAPITVLYPQDDRLMSQKDADQLYSGAYAGAKSAKLGRVPGSYHFIMLDQPEVFAGHLSNFLK